MRRTASTARDGRYLPRSSILMLENGLVRLLRQQFIDFRRVREAELGEPA